jgi:hypothetical protein
VQRQRARTIDGDFSSRTKSSNGAGTDPTVRDERREKNAEQLNTETQSAQRVRERDGTRGVERGRVPEREERTGWEATFMVYVTATRDNLSRYFLCSNDSNGVRMGRKLIRGMGMGGNLV